MTLAGYTIPAGINMTGFVPTENLNPQRFDDPTVFRLERHLEPAVNL